MLEQWEYDKDKSTEAVGGGLPYRKSYPYGNLSAVCTRRFWRCINYIRGFKYKLKDGCNLHRSRLQISYSFERPCVANLLSSLVWKWVNLQRLLISPKMPYRSIRPTKEIVIDPPCLSPVAIRSTSLYLSYWKSKRSWCYRVKCSTSGMFSWRHVSCIVTHDGWGKF